MASRIESGNRDPRPLDQQVFDIIAQTRQLLFFAEHRLGSFSANPYEEALKAAAAELDASQLEVLLKGVPEGDFAIEENLPEENEALVEFNRQLYIWGSSEKDRKAKTVLSHAYAAHQEARIKELLKGRLLTARQRDLAAPGRITSVGDGEKSHEVSGYLDAINVVTGAMSLKSSPNYFQIPAPEWTVPVIDFSTGDVIFDLEVQDQ